MLLKADVDQFSRGPDGEPRLKFYAVKVFPLSYPEEAAMLLKRLSHYQKKEEGGAGHKDEDQEMRI